MPEGKRCVRFLFTLSIASFVLLFVVYHVKWSAGYESAVLSQLDSERQINLSFEDLFDDNSSDRTTAEELRDGFATRQYMYPKLSHYEVANLSGFRWLYSEHNDPSSDIQPQTSQEVELTLDYGDDTNEIPANASLAPSDGKMIQQFLPGYRSQCWLEDVINGGTLYTENAYTSSRRGRDYFSQLTALYQELAKDGPVQAIHCLPYAMIIGFPKSGTTDLYDKLTQHPDILGGYLKEPHFWTRHRYPEYGFQSHGKARAATYRNYIELWDKPALTIRYNTDSNNFHPRVVIEGSASTIWDNRMWRRHPENENLTDPFKLNADDIKTFMPQTKLLVIMRNPTSRLYSGFTYFKGYRDDPAGAFHRYAVDAVTSMTQCLKAESLRRCVYADDDTTHKYNLTSRIYVGMYSVHVREWLKRFPRRQMLFLRLEDYSANRPAWLQKIASFLEMDPFPGRVLASISNEVKSNSQEGKEAMFPETRSLLDGFYHRYNLELARLLGDSGYVWNR